MSSQTEYSHAVEFSSSFNEMIEDAILLKNLGKEFATGVKALEKIDLRISKGEFISILGPSGCGKSTLLRLIAGLEAPSTGSMTLFSGRKVAFVFQEAHLLPWRDTLSNVLLPLELRHPVSESEKKDAKEYLERLGLGDFLKSFPHQLSGGMKMRVSLARALMTKPDILLLDEPFGALDEMTRFALDSDLRNLWLGSKPTILFVTHSLSEATFLSNRVIVLSKRPGTIVQDFQIDLPVERNSRTKTSVEFAQNVLKLTETMEASL